ncbi:pyridine nucleotide-disulfide oxidoreductase [Paenibacillus sp. BIHB 4019]|uniref:NADH:ubiquinone reductase (non-electrogenic) n=1 Tax=Paenibacillus sp. BIHB 4019 TaxID=1870819 RepID=A0A1B2DKS1_9BACL|nr:FAD-dependent oxidoreductase [Paenibacillus sp. BIHB 4019]ANY68308.1 pyridine nucleotide-disulfide oxidoreductase [Paenibacillus sp. BIHB 4019]
METLTCIVIGAGYAGIHAMKELRKNLINSKRSQSIRFVLIDKNNYHLRKVILFKPAVTDENICMPLDQMFPEEVELVEATVTDIKKAEKQLLLRNANGEQQQLSYDVLVVAIGSIIRQLDEEKGGFPLATLEHAVNIRTAWRANLQQAAIEANPAERERLMTIAVAGAGISGIETAAELAHYVRADAKQLGLNPDQVHIRLFNAHERLFLNGPGKVASKLEQLLTNNGVAVVHGSRVLSAAGGRLLLAGGEELPVGLCIWTLGLMPNPVLRKLGLPTTEDGFVNIDASYRVKAASGIYSIGDCAKVIDPDTGRSDGMTCKEAIPQAARLGKVVAADLEGRAAPRHTGYMDSFSIGLGPEKGLTWVHKWGMDIMITGKMAYRIKQFTWNIASFIK